MQIKLLVSGYSKIDDIAMHKQGLDVHTLVLYMSTAMNLYFGHISYEGADHLSQESRAS